METITQALLLWIAAHSDYSVNNIPTPSVLFMSPQEITREFYGDHNDLIPDTGVDDRVLALYDATAGSAGTIYLRRQPNVQGTGISVPLNSGTNEAISLTATPKSDLEQLNSDPFLAERLLHELVHHVQFHTGAMESFPCRAHGEKEAYRLGGIYLRSKGIEDPLPNRRFWAQVYSRC